MRSRAAAALAVCLVAVLPTAGCYQSANGTVNTMAPSGNGTDFNVGDLLVQDTTIVASPLETGRAALSLTIINPGDTPDALSSVQVAGTSATLRTAPIVVPPRGAVQIGGSSESQVLVTGLSVPAGSYADVVVTFRDSGTATRRVAVVPGVGYYESYAPAAAASAVR